jgi:hypothetical protein
VRPIAKNIGDGGLTPKHGGGSSSRFADLRAGYEGLLRLSAIPAGMDLDYGRLTRTSIG